MHIMMVTFDFKGSDLAAEERHYRDVHMALAKQFTGVNMYLAGRIRDTQLAFTPKPESSAKPYRTAIMSFNGTQDFMNSVSSPAGMQVLVDTQEHLANVQMIRRGRGDCSVRQPQARPSMLSGHRSRQLQAFLSVRRMKPNAIT